MKNPNEISLPVSAGRVTYSTPNVCIKCGEPSLENIETKVLFCPLWLYAITGVFIAQLFFEKKALMSIPICKRHRSMARSHGLLNVLRLLPAAILDAAVVVSCFGLLFAPEDALIFITLLVFFLAVAWGVAWLVRRFLINATSITDSELRLTGVSDKFANAVEKNKSIVA